jgi:prolyl oligopeptidase
VPTGSAAAPPRQLLAAEQKFNLVGEIGNEILIETDLDAPRGRIVALDFSGPEIRIREVVAQREETLEISTHSTRAIYSVLSADRIYATYVKDVAHRVLMFTTDGVQLGEAAVDGLFTVQRIEAQHGEVAVYTTRFNVPCEQHRFDANGVRVGSAAIAISGWTAPPIDAEQIFCVSEDGTRIPMFVIRPRGARGPLPTILYGYGGWGSSLTPGYRPDLAAWVERGGAYAIVNTRGGGEYGEAWHEAGARLNRIKTFEDYCAAARELIARGVCHGDSLAARGASNGGLLVCACANRCPELFAAASAGVPLVDVVNLMKLPAGAAISQEIGDPTESQAAFEYMRSYSPLQNVQPGEHRPAMLLWPGEVDDRVSASQTYKHIATLQATAKPGQVALLRVVEGEGHMSWPDHTQREVLVDELAFLWSYVAKPGKGSDVS